MSSGHFNEEDTTAEAVILGPIVPSPLAPYDTGEMARIGSVTPQLVYVNAATAAAMVPSSIPRKSGIVGTDLTPYEAFVLSVIDGQNSVRDIQRAGLLSKSEMITVIYSLLGRGLIDLHEAPRGPAPAGRSDSTAQLAVDARLQARGDVDLATTIDDDEVGTKAAASDLATTIDDAEDVAEVASLEATPGPSLVATSVSASATWLFELSGSDLEPYEDSTSDVQAAPPPQGPPPPPPLSTQGPAIQRRVSEVPHGLIPIVAHNRAPLDSAVLRSTSMLKAKQLHQAALADAHRGDFVAARMNLKLAIAFDPGNATYQQAFARLLAEHAPAAVVSPKGPSSRAQRAYDEGCAQEMRGDIDEAVRSFEDSLLHEESAIVLNRLGVLLAMKRKDFASAEALLRRAVELAPTSAVYAHNLAKVSATRVVAPQRSAPSSASEPPKAERRPSIFRRLFGRSDS